MHTAVLALHVIAAIAIVGLVLMQHGKGADMGAAFGSGSAGSLFGSAGASNFLSRTTAVLAAVFFATSLGLTYFSVSAPKEGGVTTGLEAPKDAPKKDAQPKDAPPAAPASSAPATPAAPAAPKPQEIPK
jgi:preprotein translocase subunit SecG